MNIALLTLSEITKISGEAGNFTVSITKYPRYVDMEKCIACGLCAEKCPAKTSDTFNEGLNKRKAIYIPYPQAVPLKYVIEADRCIYFKRKGRCRACEKFCPTGAINFEDRKENISLNVGSVILTAGYKPFNPDHLDNYQHNRLPNVVTSMEFERILAAGGPTGGHVQRPSDGNTAYKIAWLQCVGSRDINRCDNAYCSSVCCMYAIKEAGIAGEHVGDQYQGTVFHMDIRTFGKDFEKYYNRAKDKGVRFIRSRVHSITEKNRDGTLTLTYVTEAGKNISKDFDMAVLSVGMEPNDSAVAAAQKIGLELTPFNFVKTDDLDPVATTRPGIFVAGVLQGCKDIPSSIMEASAAACRASINLAETRGSMVRAKEFPDEIESNSQKPRIGVFVCNCGVNIGGFADVPAIAEYAKGLSGVAYVEENLFTCAQDTQDKLVKVIREKNLNRIVVAACTPRTHEPLFQETIRNAGLNPYLFEMANIRNQCTWCHSEDRDKATEKAKDLVRMAISRAALLEPIPELSVSVEKSALVIGGGVAGMTAALSLADQGFPAVIVERSKTLGGNALDLVKTWRGTDVKRFVSGLISRVKTHPDISVLLNSGITGASGFIGNFETLVTTGDLPQTINHGVTIIASGGRATDTDEYLYGQNNRVTRWHDLEQAPDRLKDADSIVFIQCVGSRDDHRPYCSNICCTASISQAIAIKTDKPHADVFVLYRDIRTPGEKELLYKKAREMGVIFIRYDLENKPVVSETDIGLIVEVWEPTIGQTVRIRADFVNLATAIEPDDPEEIAHLYKIPLNTEKFFMEAHAKLRPVDFATDGLFVCGLAHYPKSIDESISQALAAAGRAATVLARSSIAVSPLVSRVDRELCIGCGLCSEVCSFGAIEMEPVAGKGYRALNIEASCKGCGLCAASCPQHAIDMLHFRDCQIDAAIEAVI